MRMETFRLFMSRFCMCFQVPKVRIEDEPVVVYTGEPKT
jgi:hypothetical protein